MMSTGMVRRIDELGRFVIPKEIREQFDMVSNTPIEIIVDGDNVLLRKYRENHKCVFCSSEEKTRKIKDNYICNNCILEIKSKL